MEPYRSKFGLTSDREVKKLQGSAGPVKERRIRASFCPFKNNGVLNETIVFFCVSRSVRNGFEQAAEK